LSPPQWLAGNHLKSRLSSPRVCVTNSTGPRASKLFRGLRKTFTSQENENLLALKYEKQTAELELINVLLYVYNCNIISASLIVKLSIPKNFITFENNLLVRFPHSARIPQYAR
jgi:hypothetical protein